MRETLHGLLERTRNAARRAEIEAELECPPLPPALLPLWRIFQRLSRRRGSNGFALSPISWADIDAFVRHARLRLTPLQIEMIEELDVLFLTAHAAPKDRD